MSKEKDSNDIPLIFKKKPCDRCKKKKNHNVGYKDGSYFCFDCVEEIKKENNE